MASDAEFRFGKCIVNKQNYHEMSKFYMPTEENDGSAIKMKAKQKV